MQSATEISAMIAQIRCGMREGFDELYARYAGPLYGIICRVAGDSQTAKNLLEASFVNICKRINEYNSGVSFLTWAIQIALSVSREHIGNSDKTVCRDAMEMIFLAGYSYDETAQRMNVSKETVQAGVRERLRSYR